MSRYRIFAMNTKDRLHLVCKSLVERVLGHQTPYNLGSHQKTNFHRCGRVQLQNEKIPIYPIFTYVIDIYLMI